MKNLLKIMLIILSAQFSLFGYSRPIPPPLFRAETNTAILQPPLNLSENSKSSLTFQVAYSTISNLKGLIDLEGTSTDPSGIVDGQNFTWNLQNINLALGFSPKVSKNASLHLGLNLNDANKKFNIDSFDFGYNYFLTRSEIIFVSVGLGINIHQKNFYWVQNSNNTNKLDNSFGYNPYFNFTIKINKPEWNFNPFIQFSYIKQTFFNFNANEWNVYYNLNILTFSPGVSYSLKKDKNINFGFLINHIEEIKNTNQFLIVPFLQFNFLF